MGIEIPESLQWVAKYVVGAGDWPEGDETAMRRVEANWTTLATDLRELDGEATHAIELVLDGLDAQTGQALARHWDTLGGGKGAFEGLITHIESLAEEIGDGAADIEHAKLMVIGALAIFAIEMTAALAAMAAGIGAPAGAAEAATAQVATRITIRMLIKQLLTRLMSRAAATAAARAAVRGAWAAVLEEAGLEIGLEAVQVATGRRDDLTAQDWKDAGKTALIAAATGAVTGGLGPDGLARNDIGNTVGKAATDAATETAASIAGNVAGEATDAALNDRPFSLSNALGPENLASSAAGGVQRGIESAGHHGTEDSGGEQQDRGAGQDRSSRNQEQQDRPETRSRDTENQQGRSQSEDPPQGTGTEAPDASPRPDSASQAQSTQTASAQTPSAQAAGPAGTENDQPQPSTRSGPDTSPPPQQSFSGTSDITAPQQAPATTDSTPAQQATPTESTPPRQPAPTETIEGGPPSSAGQSPSTDTASPPPTGHPDSSGDQSGSTTTPNGHPTDQLFTAPGDTPAARPTPAGPAATDNPGTMNTRPGEQQPTTSGPQPPPLSSLRLFTDAGDTPSTPETQTSQQNPTTPGPPHTTPTTPATPTTPTAQDPGSTTRTLSAAPSPTPPVTGGMDAGGTNRPDQTVPSDHPETPLSPPESTTTSAATATDTTSAGAPLTPSTTPSPSEPTPRSTTPGVVGDPSTAHPPSANTSTATRTDNRRPSNTSDRAPNPGTSSRNARNIDSAPPLPRHTEPTTANRSPAASLASENRNAPHPPADAAAPTTGATPTARPTPMRPDVDLNSPNAHIDILRPPAHLNLRTDLTGATPTNPSAARSATPPTGSTSPTHLGSNRPLPDNRAPESVPPRSPSRSPHTPHAAHSVDPSNTSAPSPTAPHTGNPVRSPSRPSMPLSAQTGRPPHLDEGRIGPDGCRRFSDDAAGERYGENRLAHVYRNLPPNLRNAIYQYTVQSFPNGPLRTGHPNMDPYFDGLRRDSHSLWVLTHLNGEWTPTTRAELERIWFRPDLTPDQRALVHYALSQPHPEMFLYTLGERHRQLEFLRGYFGAEPTQATFLNRIAELDAAVDQPLPEPVQVIRGLHDISFMSARDGHPLGNRSPSLLIGTEQQELAYMSTSLGATPAVIDGDPYSIRIELDVPAGSRGLWMGRSSAYDDQRELILPRGTRYRVTSVSPAGWDPPGSDGRPRPRYVMRAVVIPSGSPPRI